MANQHHKRIQGPLVFLAKVLLHCNLCLGFYWTSKTPHLHWPEAAHDYGQNSVPRLQTTVVHRVTLCFCWRLNSVFLHFHFWFCFIALPVCHDPYEFIYLFFFLFVFLNPWDLEKLLTWLVKSPQMVFRTKIKDRRKDWTQICVVFVETQLVYWELD